MTELRQTNEIELPGPGATALLMSGGVDSSTSALLLREAGHAVVGITMQIQATEDGDAPKAVKDAAEVCRQLGIPHFHAEAADAFEELVIGRFRAAYAAGRTPNPCVDCNINMKFGLLWELARERLGAAKVATGHYARIMEVGGQWRLARAVDEGKDQSYFLSGIEAGKLGQIIFPLGGFRKEEIRAKAAAAGLHVAQRQESMELCFAGEGDYRAMLGQEAAEAEGDLLNMAGEVIGRHRGIANYTIGQRRGLGFAGGEPLYVGMIDAARNTVTLGTRGDLCKSVVEAQEVNVLAADEYVAGGRFSGKVRSYGGGSECEILEAGEERMRVRFDEAQFGPCPGQRLVIYNEAGHVVAGGTICGAER